VGQKIDRAVRPTNLCVLRRTCMESSKRLLNKVINEKYKDELKKEEEVRIIRRNETISLLFYM
jgi:hypothetical protein